MAILNNSNAISSGGYDVNNSLRFRASASAYLSRTPSVAPTNNKIMTLSMWVKRGALGSPQQTLMGSPNTGNADNFRFSTSDTLSIDFQDGAVGQLTTTQVFRDPSAWYHIVLAIDTTQATAANRAKIYINGSQVTAFGTASYPAQNTIVTFSSQNATYLGRYGAAAQNYFDGYLADVNFIDGSAKTPSDFGETDTTTGSWKPKAYTSTYGTNGFYLKFSDIATTSGSNAGLGKDFSGNTNYWTTNNISVTAGTTYDAMTDSPTLTSATVANYPTWNPLNRVKSSASPTLSSGNLKLTLSASNYLAPATINLPTTGKFYAEITLTSAEYPVMGLCNTNAANGYDSANVFAVYWNAARHIVFYPSTDATSDGNEAYLTGDIGLIAVDCTNNKVWFGRNRSGTVVWVGGGNPSSGTSPTFSASGGGGVYATNFDVTTYNQIYASSGGGSDVWDANFGQRPFYGTPPTGFLSLNTYNLPDSTIKKGNTVMDATLWTGNGTSQSIVNAGAFKPDFVWVKSRSNTFNNNLFNSTSGVNKFLVSDSTAAEASVTGTLTAFNSNGFSVGSDIGLNFLSGTYVGWQWQAGQGSTSSNTDGSITSTVSVNATAGFSVVTFTAPASTGNFSVGHGLGVSPSMVITKRRDSASQWWVWHISLGNNTTDYLSLNTTNAEATLAGMWGSVGRTSTLLGYSDTSIAVNSTQVAYCWAEIAGFSKFGSYVGNSSTDGPFIYLGFRPKFVIFKDYSNAHSWIMVDSSRNTYNVAGDYLRAESSAVENATYSVANNTAVDFLSNGFKLKNAGVNSGENNGSSNYLFMAFAENPFKNSNAR